MTTKKRNIVTPVDLAISWNVQMMLWDRRITQLQLSEATGIGQVTMSRLMRRTSPWRVSELDRVAAYFGVAADSLKLPRRDSNLQPLDNPHASGEPVAA